GVTLKDLLEVRRLTFRESAQLVAGLAEALEDAHSLGVIHRDLKPANIMLEASAAAESGTGDQGELGRPLLVGFGPGLREEAGGTRRRGGRGRAPPANRSGEPPGGKSPLGDRRSDVYGRGVALRERRASEFPSRASRAITLPRALRGGPPPPCRLNAK